MSVQVIVSLIMMGEEFVVGTPRTCSSDKFQAMTFGCFPGHLYGLRVLLCEYDGPRLSRELTSTGQPV